MCLVCILIWIILDEDKQYGGFGIRSSAPQCVYITAIPDAFTAPGPSMPLTRMPFSNGCSPCKGGKPAPGRKGAGSYYCASYAPMSTALPAMRGFPARSVAVMPGAELSPLSIIIEFG